jgi:hypothetical protein
MVGREAANRMTCTNNLKQLAIAHLLHRRQQEADKDRDDREDHQVLDQGESDSALPADL